MMQTLQGGIDLLPEARALRPVRFYPERDDIRYYDAITFPDGAYSGCLLTLRRCMVVGGLLKDGENSDLLIDILDKNGDIIQDFGVNRKGFEYLRRTLKFKVAS